MTNFQTMMFRFLLLLTAFIAGVNVSHAQTMVTLTVDMTNEAVSPDGVHVAGNFQGWDPAATPMTDNGDGTWSHTFTVDTAATYQYKYINGNAWGYDEIVPDACRFDGNRQIEVDGTGGEVSSLVCFGNCAACGMTTVRFQVDMANEEVSPFGVHVAGSFQGWDPSSTEMTDEDGDMVYETIQSFDADSADQIAFIFINGNAWTDPNELVDNECGDGSGTRVLALDASDIVLAANEAGSAYCFNSCETCVEPLAVTFNIDMSVVASVSENGVHLVGSFQGWDPAGTPMMDNGDGTWSMTVEMEPGTYEFKFINSNDWDGNEENMEGTGCNAGGNRIASFDADNSTYTACFNTCPGESCVPDPDPADVTFRVNTANQELMEGDTLFVWGSFTGWQGGAIAMTDADVDGIWEHTETISGGANVDYKYSIGHPNSEGMIEEDGVFILDGDTTNFEAAGCGAGNGFGGFYRRHVRSGVAEVLDVVCFNTCNACPSSYGCTNLSACNYNPEASIDDGSCDYSCQGCTNDAAFNFDAEATIDDGSCVLISCNDVGSPLWDTEVDMGLHMPPSDVLMHGVEAQTEWIIHLPSVVVEPSSGQFFATQSWSGLEVSSLPPGLTVSLQSNEVLGSQQLCVEVTGVPEMPGEYMVETTGLLTVSVFGSPFEIGTFATETAVEILANPNPILGCAYVGAVNYVPYADVDNGTCLYAGCTDPEALNYYPFITLDDGSCLYGDVVGPTCPSDIDQDGAVTTSDLLTLLSTFGLDCE